MKKTGKLFIISGPSQVGKDSVVRTLKKNKALGLTGIVTNTTRAKRPGEKSGVELNFLTDKKFDELIKKGELLEWAYVRGGRFGTPKKPVISALNKRQDVIINIDVQCTKKVVKQMPQAITIFITAESTNEVRRRIFLSKKMTLKQKKYRWQEAQKELKAMKHYDYIVINRWGKLAETTKRVANIINKLKNAQS